MGVHYGDTQAGFDQVRARNGEWVGVFWGEGGRMSIALLTDTGKNLRVWGVRGSRLGDTCMAAPTLAWLRQRFPDCYTHWQIARRHAEAGVPLWLNHPLIDQIVVSDCEEGMGPRDIAIAETCQIRFNLMPEHPDGDRNWATRYTIWEETWRMAGLPIGEYRALSAYDQRCHLTQWFEVERQPKRSIALWPASNYGVRQDWHSRYPSRQWMMNLVFRLEAEGYHIIQCGHPKDYANEGGPLACRATSVLDARQMSFVEQVRLSLGCDAIIGTDSGSTLVLAAYESVPTIQLLTDHMPGGQTPLAFASNSPTNVPLFAAGSADNISIDTVVQTVHSLTKT